MIVPIRHFDWQVLRFLVRAEASGEYPIGRQLRLIPTRLTKDGTFLDDMVEAGLIAVAAKPAKPEPGREKEPAQFRARYKLTDKGRHAAEYGEVELVHTPKPDPPLTGLAAEALGPIIEKAERWKQAAAAEEDKPTGRKGRRGGK